jgi:YidC/Oxa1 family membrane protein insertase
VDKNSIIGLVLIFGILIGFSIYNSPSEAELALQQKRKDSVQAAERIKVEKSVAAPMEKPRQVMSDSLVNLQRKQAMGSFFQLTQGKTTYTSIQNNRLKLSISNKGARPVSALLQGYKTSLGKPVDLISADSSSFALVFPSEGRTIRTDSLYFVYRPKGDNHCFEARIDSATAIIFEYALPADSFHVQLNIRLLGMGKMISANATDVNLDWKLSSITHEKNKQLEASVTSVFYRYADGEVDNLSETGDDKESLPNTVTWVSFKQQYFCSALIQRSGFQKPTDVSVLPAGDSSAFTKHMAATFTLPYKHGENEVHKLQFYFGPNHFKTLASYNISLEDQLNLGWGIIGWINLYAIIPIFNILTNFNINMGIVILLMCLIIKIVILPLTYKAYLSSAKMKVLKPEMDEINVKFEKEDPMKKQQAIMALYRKAGVNPLGGCIPLLLQLPILLAVLRFFPASIELRQKAFLWAADLSSYDSIFTLPFTIPMYGDHVSLFTLLMTASTIIYTRMNSSQFSGNAQMEQMKWMMYLMPLIFMFSLNSYSSGLTYYYFIANMMTFGIQYLMKLSVNEEAIHRKIQENKKKPVKKSRFQQKLEEMTKQQQALQQQARKKKK